MTSLCVRARAFLYFDISHTVWHMSVSPWYNVSRTFMTSVWPWPLTLISKLYIHYEFESGIIKIVFALLHRHTKFWHMSVSPWNMMCTFLTYVWPWPLTYKWVVYLVSFSHSFYLVSFFFLRPHESFRWPMGHGLASVPYRVVC